MASVSTQKNTGLRRVIFHGLDGRRSAIHVGKIPLATAREIAGHIDHLMVCRQSSTDCRRSTRDWILRIRSDWPRLASRLADMGLIAAPLQADQPFTDFVDNLLSSRTDVKPNTLKLWRQTAEKIRLFFGNRMIRSLTAKDGSNFIRWLGTSVDLGGAGHTASTPGKHLTIAKGFLSEAVDAEILSANPFQKIHGDRTVNRRRRCFIPTKRIEAVINCTEDLELRTIIALSRWGGLRTPSEPFALRWQHIDWGRCRITVPAVKTKLRELPLFPELVPYLQALLAGTQNQLPDGYLFPRLKKFSDSNLRKQLKQTILSAGLTPWPKIFHNLRASRQTELEERFPRKTVCEWMGNSEAVADQHYLQVLEDHFDRAVIAEETAGWLISDSCRSDYLPTIWLT